MNDYGRVTEHLLWSYFLRLCNLVLTIYFGKVLAVFNQTFLVTMYPTYFPFTHQFRVAIEIYIKHFARI